MVRQRKKSLPGRLRIVAGKWRSRLLEIVDEPGLRPTPERIRETLFNWLAPRIEGANCLDLFAGTGVLGLEALSRGAARAVLVEKSRRAADRLQSSIDALGANDARLVRGDALEFLHQWQGEPFDIVFLDPPFAADLLPELCRLLDRGTVLTADARVYLEQDRAASPVDLPPGWQVLKSGTGGNVRYSLLRPRSKP